MIGILGGTFDPVHFGHLRPALEIKNALDLETICLVPCGIPPHRPPAAASAAQRIAMLEAAVAEHPAFTIDQRELQREGPSYTLDTLKSFRKDIGSKGLCLLLGGDAFLGLATWHRWHELIDYCHIVVMTRPGFGLPTQGELAGFVELHKVNDAAGLHKQSAGMLWFQNVTQLDISGTRIRKLIAEGGDAAYLLPNSVLKIIKKEGLFRPGE